MALAQEQIDIAARIDAKVQQSARFGCDDLDIFIEMFDDLPGFKRLMDTAGQGGMDELTRRFPGLLRYAKILETAAAAIESSKIEVPK
jgi:hypothetical protein